MSQKVYSFEEAKNALKNYLPMFLEEEGIFKAKKSNEEKESWWFRSFYSDKEDKDPSCHVFRGRDSGQVIYHDFSKNITGDIFMAHNVIKNAPLLGYEFVTDNLKALCDRYGLTLKMRAPTQEEIEIMNIRTVYSMVKDIIVYNLRYGNIDPKVQEYMDDKKITKNDSTDFLMGYVPSWDNLRMELEARGISEKYLEDISIHKGIFNSNNLIFVVQDERGRVSGFAARNCYFNKEDGTGIKYINTDNNILYNKGSLLYNLNRALKKKVGKHSSLYISEGYTDARALDKGAGLKAAALGSTSFTNEHISLLQRVGENDIVLILDGDKTGIEQTARTITEVMKGIRSFRVRIVTLPDGLDPDEYIRKYGREALLELPHITAFEWELFRLRSETDFDPHELADQVIPLIVNETSEIQKDRMCIQVAEICKLPVDIIRKQVRLISDNDKIKMVTERDAVLDNIVKGLKLNPEDAQLILSNGQRQVSDITEKHNANIYDQDEYVLELDNIKLQQEMDNDMDFLNLYRMPRWAERMKGSVSGKLFLLGGQPNAGKTAYLINWAIAALRAGEASEAYGQRENKADFNDICIFFHTVDDARYEIIPKFISALASDYHNEVFINAMDKPNIYKFKDYEGVMTARAMAFNKMKQWGKEGRLVIKDATMGTTLVAGEHVIQNLKQKYPDRNIIYLLDNLYNLTDFAHYEDETKRVQERVNVLKGEILVPNKIMGFATVEYRKGSDKGMKGHQALNEMIKESKTLEYRANWIGHLLNELHTDPDNTDMWFWDHAIPIEKRTLENRSPIVTLAVSKNKVSSFKGQLHYYFFQNRALHIEVTRAAFENMTPSVRERLRSYYYSKDEAIERGGLSGIEEATGGSIDKTNFDEEDGLAE